jgi:hypothetical protein
MNYRIVGADGKVYGPAGLEQLRQWLAEGRVESRTPVHVEGASQWTTLGALPELAATRTTPPPTVGALPASPAPARGTNGWATASLICGLLSWICCCCPPLNLLGIIFSIIALAQIRSQAQPQDGRVLAIIGLALSAANLLFVIVMSIIQMVFGNTTINWQTGQF